MVGQTAFFMCIMNKFSFPFLGFGLGLRAPHYDLVMKTKPKVGWFEIISENFIDAHEGYWEYLSDLRPTYPIVMHGVSLSIGSTDPIKKDYLTKVKTLADHIKSPWVSDHLCFTGVNGLNSHDLLPVPYTVESLNYIVDRIKLVQDFLGRNIILENPSTYLEFTSSSIPEWEYLAQLAEQADCGLLLDVNNVYVSSKNHNYDCKKYIDTIPADRIVQIHLAGHQDYETHAIDTHDQHVIDKVWELYRYTLTQKGIITTMIEWDDHIPEFDVLQAEIAKAEAIANSITMRTAA